MTKVALRHRYEPRGAARELFQCRAAEVLLSGAVDWPTHQTEEPDAT